METNTNYCRYCEKSYSSETVFCPVDGTELTETPKSTGIGAGIKIGEYLVEKKLGEGGMGEVWSARQPQINKQVAIKLLSPKLTTNNHAVSRFVQEARSVNEIQHPNIIDIFSFGELANGRPYFVMELLKGSSLSAYVKEKGPLPFPEIVSIFEQICSALQAAHDKKVIHRDLKPDNIFLATAYKTKSNKTSHNVKLLDFGIAKLSVTEGESLTNTGAMMGTPAYMSPEQCEGAKAVDWRSDIYSLGIVLYEMLTGRTPFRAPGDGVGIIISRQMLLPPAPPSLAIQGRIIPKELDAVVLRSLSKKPSERFQSCDAFFQELEKLAPLLSSETFESLKGAKPIFTAQQDNEEPIKNLIAGEFAKSNTLPLTQETPLTLSDSMTGNYYSGTPQPLIKPIQPANKKVVAAVAFASLVLVVGILFVFMDNPATKDETSPITTTATNRVTIPNINPPTTTITTSQPASLAVENPTTPEITTTPKDIKTNTTPAAKANNNNPTKTSSTSKTKTTSVVTSSKITTETIKKPKEEPTKKPKVDLMYNDE